MIGVYNLLRTITNVLYVSNSTKQTWNAVLHGVASDGLVIYSGLMQSLARYGASSSPKTPHSNIAGGL